MKRFMEGSSNKERTMLLQENAAKTEVGTYQIELSAEGLALRREELAENWIKFNGMQDKLKEVKENFKLKMKPLMLTNQVLLTEIKTKQTTLDGTLYHLADHEQGIMEVWDADGNFIRSRKLLPDEKQGNIFQLGRVN